MSKQDKKNKRDKNELDLILAQLKKSYNDESTDELEDVDDSLESNDNAEFNEILEKLFESAGSTPSTSNEEKIEPLLEEKNFEEDSIAEEAIVEELVEEEPVEEEPVEEEPVEEEPVEEEPVEEEPVEKEAIEAEPIEEEPVAEATLEAVIENNDDVEAFETTSLFEKSINENQSESDVDGVLQLMFANNAPKKEDTDETESCEDSDETDEAIIDTVDDDRLDGEVDEIDESLIDTIYDDPLDEKVDETAPLSYFDDDSDESCIDESSVEEIYTEDETLYDTDSLDFTVEDEEYDDESDEIEEISHIILDPALYTFDPLQEGLPEFSTTSVDASDPIIVTAPLSDDQPQRTVKNESVGKAGEAFNANDISLLLKFGYGEEVKSQIGEEEAQKVLAENDSSFRPESHKIPYGFCGKEFSDRSQAKQIKEKFKSDKNVLILQLILVSLIAIAMLAVEIFFEFVSDRSSYLIVNAVEMVLIAVTFLILNKKLISGILGIVRFEANLYSILAYLIFAYTLCNIATSLLYVIKSSVIDTSGLMVFGFCIMLYVMFVLISELVNCLRESSNFDLICQSESFYTAEKHTVKSSDNASSIVGMTQNPNAYRLTKTSLLSGYFRKSSKSVSGNVNLIYIIGIVPILSLIIGCSSALISENVMRGVFSMMITTLLCIPFACVIVPSVTEYILSLFFKNKKIAFIGNDAVEKLAKADSLFFDDTNAVEIISYTEIHPTKSTDGQKMLEIARRVFKALDGPLGEFSKIHSEEAPSTENKKSDVVINSIADNGIEIYFESSINILIGDKSYMQAHNIKVKTDSNLNTAIKGFDRSVIYMAFDGIPKLGFIITSKIKPEFSSVASMLDENGIKVFVDTYEPQINDLYFEQNKAQDSHIVSVCKSEDYESTDYKRICDGNIVCSSDSFALAEAILACRKIVNQRKKYQRTHFTLVICGFILSCLFTALLNINQEIFILSGLKFHASLVLNIVMLISLIPGAINIFKTRRAQREGQNDKKESK